MKLNYGKILIWLAIITTPAAMVAFLTLEIRGSIESPGTAIWTIVISAGAFLSAVGVETTGILSGHAFERFTRRKEWIRATVVLFFLIAYTAVAMRILWENEMLRYIPLVAAIVYVLAALVEGVESVEESEHEATTKQNEFDLEQQAKDREHQREMKAIAAANKHAEKMAQIETGAATSKRRDVRHDNGEIPGDWRQLTRQQKHKLAHATREEREEMFPSIEPRTRRDWHVRLDKIAAQNGEYVV